jgi:hypothetical protein
MTAGQPAFGAVKFSGQQKQSAAVITGRLCPPVLKDLLFRAKDLFIAAMVSILPLAGGTLTQRTYSALDCEGGVGTRPPRHQRQ